MTPYEKKEAARLEKIQVRAERAADRAREKTLAQLKVRAMSPAQYRAALKKHDVSIVGASSYFGVSRRQAQRIAAEGPVPKLIAKVLELLNTGKLQKEDLL